MEEPLILVINPGSMTTKVAIYAGEKEIAMEELAHSKEQLASCQMLLDQLPLRKEGVLAFTAAHLKGRVLSALACRGAPLKPLESGTYRIDEHMIDDIRSGKVQSPHVSMLGILMGWDIGKERGIPAFITDPISVDEFIPEARISGLPDIPRKSLWHALNCRAVARTYADALGKSFSEMNLIVAHMGSGMTVVCLEKGRAIDAIDANNEAPISPERIGNVPLIGFTEMCFSGAHTKEQVVKMVTREGGLKAHLGTNDGREIERRIGEGDEHALTVYKAMAYQISKTIGGMATTVNGRIDAILLTGSLARSSMLTKWIDQSVSFIAPVRIFAGQEEMKALAFSVLRVLSGKEKEKIYQ
ncbi:MAG: butyrate kinase [Vulcanimicrobiota bacterium]